MKEYKKDNKKNQVKDTENDNYIQWHPAFVAAMKLELREYAHDLYFDSEHVVNKASIKVDLLLIKRRQNTLKKHEWGSFFEKHNLFEYKGVGDVLDWRVFSKGLGYTYLYISQGIGDDSRKWEETTLTFMRQSRPDKLLKSLKEHDFMVEKKEEGVYHISKKIMFKVQIIVLREVSFDRHPWLKALTRDMGLEQLRRLFSEERKLVTREEIDNAAAVLEVVVKSNKKMFKQLGGDEIMGEALMELVRPQIDALLAEKDKEIAEITNQAAERDAMIAEITNQAVEKDNEIRKLKEQIKKLQEQVI